MIKLEPVNQRTYPVFFDNIVNEFIDKTVTSGQWNQDEAPRLAKEEVEKRLPDKHLTKGHFIYSILSDEENIGYIWAGKRDSKGKEAFIYAFEVYSSYRNKGNGKYSFTLLEKVLKDKGFEKISLHVYEESDIALNMYKGLDYKTQSRIMSKDL